MKRFAKGLIALTVLVTLMMSRNSFAQGWVLEVEVDINHADCAAEVLKSATVSFAGASASGSSTGSKAVITLKGTGSTQNQVFSVDASASCSQAYDPAKPVGNFSESYSQVRSFTDCSSSSYSSFVSGDNIDVDGYLKFYPRMAIGTPVFSCGRVTLTTTNCSSLALKWEVTDNLSGGTWYTIANKTSSSIEVGANELHNAAFATSMYNKRWVRVTSVSGTTSPAVELTVPAPPPSITNVSGVRPLCPDGTGSIQVNHGSDTPLGVEFVYTVQQYVRKRNGSCFGDYGTGNTLDQQGINQVTNLCGGASGINVGSEVFCSGFIGNYKKTFTSSDLSYTLSDNSIEQTSAGTGTGNYLKLYPGVYIVEIEKKSGQDGYDCICRYVVEIPPANAVLDIPESSIVKTSPSCVNGNNGSAQFQIGIRGKYNASYDIKYTILKERSGSFSVYNSRADILANLTSGKVTVNSLESGNYKLQVWDICSNYPVSVPFTIGAGPPFSLSRTITHPKCLTDANSDGVAESGDGRIRAVPTAVSGVTYYYSLYSSGGSVLRTWSTTSNSHSFSSLINAGYYVTVKTSNNCKGDSVLTVLNAPTPLALKVLAQDATCSNTQDGKIVLKDISKTTGTIRYAYKVDKMPAGTPATSGTGLGAAPDYTIPADIGPGTYRVTVTDQCVVAPNTQSFNNLIINAPPRINIEQQSDIRISCFDGITTSPVVIRYRDGIPPFAISVRRDDVMMEGFPVTNGAATSFEVANLPIGEYKVSVTDQCNETSDMIFHVTSNAVSNIQASITCLKYDNNLDGTLDDLDFHLTCPEKNDGRIQVRLKGGVQNQASPKYQIELLDGSGIPRLNNVSGNNNAFGSISAGTEVSNEIVFEIKGLSEDIPYMIRVTDYNTQPSSCSRVFDRDTLNRQLTLSAPPPLSVQAPDPSTDFANSRLHNGILYVICKDDSNVVYNPRISGGNPPYDVQLLLSDPRNSEWALLREQENVQAPLVSFPGLAAGSYRLELADRQQCGYQKVEFELYQAANTLEVDSVFLYEFPHGANTSCADSDDGKLFLQARGGVGNYTFFLSGLQDTVSVTKSSSVHWFTDLRAVDNNGRPILYTVLLRDELSCQWNPRDTLNRIRLTPPQKPDLLWEIISETAPGFEIPCRGDMAMIRVRGKGGHYPYYARIGDKTKPITSPDSFADFPLYAGSYEISLLDELGCVATPQALVLRQPDTSVAIHPGEIRSPVCIGGADGKIDLGASGGVTKPSPEEYSFLIRTSGSLTFDPDTLTGTVVTFLRAANGFSSQDYDVTVLDGNGCRATTSVTMPVQPQPLTLKCDTIVGPSCHGGSDGFIKLTAANYDLIDDRFLIFKLSGGNVSGVREVSVAGPTVTFDGLQASDLHALSHYSAWVEDKNHCADTAFQFSAPLRMQSPTPLVIDLLLQQQPTCQGNQDGLIFLKVSGGTPPYEISDNDQTYDEIAGNNTVRFDGLPAAVYQFYARDSKILHDSSRCKISAAFEIGEGRSIDLNETMRPVSCKGGSDGSILLDPDIDSHPAGETFDPDRFSAQWFYESSGDQFSASKDVLALSTGNYVVRAAYSLDSVICYQQRSFRVLEPAVAFHIDDIKSYPASCGDHRDGKAIVSASGGWSDSTIYYRVDNGPWLSVNETSFLLTSLAPGEHLLEMAQSNFSCADSLLFVIPSDPLGISATVSQPSCPFSADGILLMESTIAGVTFFLDGREDPDGIFENMRVGVYQIYAEKPGDSSCRSEVLTVEITDPPDCGNGPLRVKEVTSVPATCPASSDGKAIVSVEGGAPPYRFFWNGSNVKGSGLRVELPAGSHQVTIIDTLNTIITTEVGISSLSPLEMEMVSGKASCYDTCDGSVSVLVSGGSGTYRIVWNDEATDLFRMDLCPGDHGFTVVDAQDNRCVLYDTAMITHQDEISVQLEELSEPTCTGGDDGSIRLHVTGGSGAYGFIWSNGATSQDVFGLAAARYGVRVLDKAFGCEVSADFMMEDAPEIMIDTVLVHPPECFGEKNGSARLLTTGTGVTIRWDDGQVGEIANNLDPGAIGFTLTDSKGCKRSGTATIPGRAPIVAVPIAVSRACYGMCKGEISLVPSGGVPDYKVVWSHGPKSFYLDNLCPGVYGYAISDNNNCMLRGTVELNSPELLEVNADVTEPTCYQRPDGKIHATPHGGTPPYQFHWNTGETGPALASLVAGTYTVVVTDSDDCQIEKTFHMTEPDPMIFDNTEFVMPSCFGEDDGSLGVKMTGGAQPYSYRWSTEVTTPRVDSLKAGSYEVTGTDAKGCSLKKTLVLDQPALQEFVNVSVSGPSCHDKADGALYFDVTGGTFPWEFRLNENEVGSAITGLAGGIYLLRATDYKGCAIEMHFELQNPDEPVITGIMDEIILCSGSLASIIPDGHWNRFLWNGPAGFQSVEQKIVTGIPGDYLLNTWDQRGCLADKQFLITTTENALRGDFLRISTSVVFSPVVFLDISSPPPQRVEWIISNQDDIIISNQSMSSLELIFTSVGQFEIGMRAYLDKCTSELFRTIDVVEAGQAPDDNSGRKPTGERGDISVTLFPNPAMTNLDIMIRTTSQDPVNVRLVRAVESRVLLSHQVSGATEYAISWDVRELNNGVHFILFEQNGMIHSERLMIMK